MKSRIAINGLGRIGRLVLRNAMRHECLEVVAVNDIAAPEDIVYLLRHDSIYGKPDTDIWTEDSSLHWGDHRMRFLSEPDPSRARWGDLGVDIVVEATGRFTARGDATKHLSAGAGYVLISAPAKEPDITLCMGVNEDAFDPRTHRIVSNGSCTTNCLAPIAMVLDRTFKIQVALLTTIHAYTSSQSLVDSPNRKHRRGRAAAISIVPTTTGAAKAVAEVLPNMQGKLNGMAFRVPVADGSVLDLVVQTELPMTVSTINEALVQASEQDRLRAILSCTDDELVSADIVGLSHSALIDLRSTMVLGDRMAKIVAWYDNEWGYAVRVVDMAAHMAECATPAQVLPAEATTSRTR